ncbi:MAG: hypothetical protein H6993_07750 [Pseudomonadales bacterium]|nr:hypothetical protein [Pseudomonadales bacterium]MCP5183841.1 hypothetical protein [Pseudomonadales bacterium]
MSETDHRRPAAIGVWEHNGWAVAVAIGVEVGEPVILDRRRLDLLSDGLPQQPYQHDTINMPDVEAQALVDRVRADAMARAKVALQALVDDLDADTWRIDVLTLREPAWPDLPTSVAEVHANQRALHVADGMIYHDAVVSAAAERGLEIVFFHKNDVLSICCDRLDCSAHELEEILLQFGKEVGSPWQKEHQMAAAGAIDALFR